MSVYTKDEVITGMLEKGLYFFKRGLKLTGVKITNIDLPNRKNIREGDLYLTSVFMYFKGENLDKIEKEYEKIDLPLNLSDLPPFLESLKQLTLKEIEKEGARRRGPGSVNRTMSGEALREKREPGFEQSTASLCLKGGER